MTIVKPSTQSHHKSYTFYLRVGASGGTFYYYGPFYIVNGCTGGSSTSPVPAIPDSGIAAGGGFSSTGTNVEVGYDVSGAVYTFVVPTFT